MHSVVAKLIWPLILGGILALFNRGAINVRLLQFFGRTTQEQKGRF